MCLDQVKECDFFASNLSRGRGRNAVLKESFLWNQPCRHFPECPLSINGPQWGEIDSPISSSGRWAEKEVGQKIESLELGPVRGYFLLFIVSAWLTNSDRGCLSFGGVSPIKTKHCSNSWGLKIGEWNSILNLLHKVALLILPCSFLRHKTLDFIISKDVTWINYLNYFFLQ